MKMQLSHLKLLLNWRLEVKNLRPCIYSVKVTRSLGTKYYAQAEDAYQRSIRVFPGNIKPRMGLASLLPDNEQGRLEAEEIYQQVLQLKPNYSPAYFLLASIYSQSG